MDCFIFLSQFKRLGLPVIGYSCFACFIVVTDEYRGFARFYFAQTRVVCLFLIWFLIRGFLIEQIN
jgi:hypothetical protein